MMANYKCAFDEEGQRLAILSSDGRIRVWDCSTGKLRQEFVAAASLGLTCTCLCWSKSRQHEGPYKSKKKAKRTKKEQTANVVVGALDGSVVVIDVNIGELSERLTGGHTSVVNDLCYCGDRDTLYSCSNDKHITEWDSKFRLKMRWAGGKHSVKVVAVGPSGKTLLSAGRLIKLWDLESKELLQKFNGHANYVSRLLWTPVRSEKSNPDCHTSGYYFLSCAQNDELVNAWQVNLTKPDKNSVASFMLPSVPVSLDFQVLEEDGQPLKLAAACKNGSICLISHALNGRCQKPITPEYSTSLVNAEAKSEDEKTISILASRFNHRNSLSLTVAYGSHLKPIFENLDLSSIQNHSVLNREISSNLLLNNEKKTSIVASEGATTSNEYTVIGDLSSVRPSLSSAGDVKNKEEKNQYEQPLTGDNEIPFSKRIRDLLPATQLAERAERPTAASTANLIIQAIQRDDVRMLYTLLRKNQSPTVVKATMERLPLNLIIPFLRKIAKKIEAEQHWIHHSTIWLKITIELYMTYLLSIPNLRKSLSGLYQIMEQRTSNFQELSKLHGRLDLVLSYASRSKKREEPSKFGKPLIHFHDDDSDIEVDYDVLGRMALASDSEEDWNPSTEEEDNDKAEEKNEAVTDEKPVEPRVGSRNMKKKAGAENKFGASDEENYVNGTTDDEEVASDVY